MLKKNYKYPKRNILLLRVVYQIVLLSIYTSLIEVITYVLTIASLQYLLSYFSFIFLEGYYSTLFSVKMLVTFFHLAPATQRVLVPPKVQCPWPKFHSRVVLSTLTISSSSSPLQVSTSQPLFLPQPQQSFLPSEQLTQCGRRLLPLPSRFGAFAPLCASFVFSSTAV